MWVCRKCGKAFKPRKWQVKRQHHACRPCIIKYQLAWIAKRKQAGLRHCYNVINNERRRIYTRAYFSKPHNRKKRAEQAKRYVRDPKLRIRWMARWAAQKAVESGKLIKTACQQCESATKVEAHHADYTKPLEVAWLCFSCHREWHRNNTPIYGVV